MHVTQQMDQLLYSLVYVNNYKHHSSAELQHAIQQISCRQSVLQ